ncbi:phosphoribosylamine--glycine ligase, chloroplastic-like [Silene latifolia]|uniref:phosphoribosylamine--glycine ligase, chloroplastic-like n=1 Tax=Silene latifolia TaxID=37657 RepID=UPI003D78AF92
MASLVAPMFCSEVYIGSCCSWKQVSRDKGMMFGPRMKPSAFKVSFGFSNSLMCYSIKKSNVRSFSSKSDTWIGGGFNVASERNSGLDCWMMGGRNEGGRASFVVSCIANDGVREEEKVSVLVIGGGGREHALCYALQRSPSSSTVYCAPGNVGISSSGDAICLQDIDPFDSSAVISFCQKQGIGLVVVGPEGPLVSGFANDLAKAGIPTFGPSSEAAALKGSKDFMKNLCYKYGIPTAKVGL